MDYIFQEINGFHQVNACQLFTVQEMHYLRIYCRIVTAASSKPSTSNPHSL
jgi:hypothetical protein